MIHTWSCTRYALNCVPRYQSQSWLEIQGVPGIEPWLTAYQVPIICLKIALNLFKFLNFQQWKCDVAAKIWILSRTICAKPYVYFFFFIYFICSICCTLRIYYVFILFCFILGQCSGPTPDSANKGHSWQIQGTI